MRATAPPPPDRPAKRQNMYVLGSVVRAASATARWAPAGTGGPRMRRRARSRRRGASSVGRVTQAQSEIAGFRARDA